MNLPVSRAIGGYFELEMPRNRGLLHEGALHFQSSRAAFLALLRTLRPTAVWMPWYICDAMIEPLRMAGISVRRYELDAQFRPRSTALAHGEWLLYVNYFGLCDDQVDEILGRYPADCVVIDNAQAMFAKPRHCLATLYSPRKFVGVPDGGHLVTQQRVEPPVDVDPNSLRRCTHLLERLAHDAEAGYGAYAKAEDSLKEQEPLRMSALTHRMLASIDYDYVRERRVANFTYLHERLRQHNQLPLRYRRDAVPLCYPFLGATAGLRELLRSMRIYTPSYWPDIETTPGAPAFERQLPNAMLFLPCDQRLTPEDLAPIAQHLIDRLT
ncbi:hypothetical protein P3T18_002203 [Paraburkholderia sp. GAS199]|uniref:hypothetical protein n=1 Tax=Paraburkholderia sp. GAS199 TaxID=3035126 RepID=UPI003D23AE0C